MDLKKYLFQNFGNKVIIRYDEFEKIINSTPELFNELFPQYNLNFIQRYSFTHVLNILEHIYASPKSLFKEKVENIIQTLCVDIKKLSNDLTVDNIFRSEQTVREFIRFLRKINHVNANEFEIIQDKIDNLLNEYMIKNGHIFKEKLAIPEMKVISDSKADMFIKLRYITHIPNINTLKWESKLNVKPNPPNPFLDFVSTNIPTNDYFTFTHQLLLDIITVKGREIIKQIVLNRTIFPEFEQGLYEELMCIAKETHHDEEELTSDYLILTQMIDNVSCLAPDNDKVLIQSLCYGAATFICAFSEKILRIVYFEEMKDKMYIPLNKATIGTLLEESNEAMIRILGKYQIKHLNYYLGQDKNNMVGKGYRNKLAHWNELTSAQLNPNLVYLLLFLIVSIINSITLYYSDAHNQISETNTNTAELGSEIV